MSYILEALKKSDAERKRGEIPTLETTTASTAATQTDQKSLMPWIVSGVLGVVVLGLGGVLVWDRLQPPAQTTMTVAERVAQANAAPKAQIQEPVQTPVAKAPAPDKPVPSKPLTAVQKTELGSADKPVTVYTPPPQPEKVRPAPSQEVAPQETDTATDTDKTNTETEQPVETDSPATANAAPVEEDAPQAQAAPVSPVEPAKPLPAPKIIRAQPSVPEPTGQDGTTKETEVASLPAQEAAPSPAGRTADTQRAAANLVNKAWSAIDKGFYNQAMRDLDRALKLEPGFAEAWFARGWTNEKSGKELSAIGDYARAINAQPDHAYALFSRGYLNLYVADPKLAVTDFIRTRGVAQSPSLELYSQLWLYLSRLRAGQDAQAKFAEDTARAQLDAWPGPIVRRYLGQITDQQLLAIMDEAEPLQRPERQCTGHFFLGILALKNGDGDAARDHFEKVLATGAVQLRQFDAAKRELNRLGG